MTFRRFWKSHTGTTLKTRRPVPTDAPGKISTEDGVKVSGFWTVEHVINKHWHVDKDFYFQGCDFFEFSKIVIFTDLTNVSYTVLYALSHCGNEDFFGRSKWSFMTQLHFLCNSRCPFFLFCCWFFGCLKSFSAAVFFNRPRPWVFKPSIAISLLMCPINGRF